MDKKSLRNLVDNLDSFEIGINFENGDVFPLGDLSDKEYEEYQKEIQKKTEEDEKLILIFPYKRIKQLTEAIYGVGTKYHTEDDLNDSVREGYFQTDNLQYHSKYHEMPEFGQDETGNGYLYFENTDDYDFDDVRRLLGVGFIGEGIETHDNKEEVKRILDLIENESSEKFLG